MSQSGRSVAPADLDADGDVDLLAAHGSESPHNVTWYENLGGGSFGGEQLISTSANSAQSVFAVDLDGDDDADAGRKTAAGSRAESNR